MGDGRASAPVRALRSVRHRAAAAKGALRREPAGEPLLPEGVRTVHRADAPGTPSAVICSRATGTHIELLSNAVPTLLAYGERHGWDVVISTEEELAEGRPASWGKLPLIRELLDQYDLVWWVDSDALIVDASVDLREELVDGKDLYLVEHLFPAPHDFAASAGVMLWRSSDWSKALVDALWASEAYVHHRVWENAALLELLGYGIERFHHPAPTPLMARVQLLSPDWNSVWPDPARSPKVHHHGGSIEFADRRRFMIEDLARFRRGRPPVMEGGLAERPDQRPGPRRLLTPAHPAEQMSAADLPRLLCERGLIGRGVELGTFAGERAARWLWCWPGEHLTSVDAWDHEAVEAAAAARLHRFGERSARWRTTSAEAALRIGDATLDVAWVEPIDQDAAVADELERWVPKVRPGGIVAGPASVEADRWWAERGAVVHVTGGPGPSSWIVELGP
jgi:hypothetical protein